MFQFSKYPMDILEMLSGHQAHQFKGLGLERQLSHQQQVQLQHQQQLQQQHQPSADTSGSLLSGLGLGSLQSSRSNAFADSSSLFAKMSAPPSISHQSQSSSSHSSRKSSKMSSSSSGSSSSGYPQFLRPFHPAEAALAQEQLHSGMGRFDFGGSGGGVVTPAPPPPPLHPGLSVPQPSSGPPTSSPSSSTSASVSNNPSGSTAVPLVGQSDPRSLHQQFSCMLAANQYFLSGVPTNSSLEQFLVQQGTHNHLGLGLGQGSAESNSLAPPPSLHSSHSHSHTAPQPQQQQQQLTPHALSHPHSHTHHPHPLHPAPQPAPLGGFDFQGIPVLSSNQIASLMQQEAGLPLPLPLHLSLSKDDSAKAGDSSSTSTSSGGGSRRKKAMAGYLPQRKSDSGSHGHSTHSHSSGSVGNCHNSSSSGHSQSSSSGLVGGGSGGVGISGIGSEPPHSSLLSSSSQQSSSTVSSSSSSSAPSSNSTSVLVANGNQHKSQGSHSNSSSGQPEPEPLYHCGECGKTFTHLSSLRRHLRSHGLTPESQSRKSDCNSPSPERIFCCGECGKRFKKRGHLIQHSVTHSENRPFACNICQKSFNRRESLTRHEKIHDEKPFRCPACGRCFRESTSLLNHAASGACGKPPRSSKNRANAGGSGSNNPSSSKMRSSGDTVGISNNSAALANDKYATDYSRNRYQNQSPYSGGVDDYRRSQPSSLYSSESTLASEMASQTLRKAPLAPTLHPHPQNQHHHHQQQPPPQQPHLPLSSLLDDSEDEVTSSAMSAIAAAAAASCDINTEGREGERRDIIGGLLGGLGFGNLGGPSSTSSLNGSTMPLTHPSQPHMKPRKPRKPREKRDPNTIVRRRRSPAPPGDGSERPYSCQICGKRFRRAETLRRHNRVHTGEKPHSCDVCGKMFREPFHLTKHLTVHSGQKNYKCNLCGKMFAYAQSLVRHGKLHRRGEIDNQGRRVKGAAAAAAAAAAAISQVPNSGNADYFSSCSQGEKSPTHGTPSQRLYTCTVCWKSFRHYFHLTAHQQTVHGGGVGLEKSFRCEVCGKAFAYSNSLVRHKLSQHGLDRSGQRVNQSQPSGYSPLFYDSGSGPNYAGGTHMQQGAPGPQQQPQQTPQVQHPFHYRPKNFQKRQGGTRKHRKKKRRVVIHSIMRDGKLVGVPLSKDTRKKLLMLRKRRGKLQAQLNKKKLLAQLRVKGSVMKVKSWTGGAVTVTGLSSMDIPIKRFPCPICPSAMYAKQGSLMIHYAIRHPPRNSGRGARLRCQVCGRRNSSLHKALKHRGQHVKQAAFQCHKCRHRFWNPGLLARHKFSCRGSTSGSGNWELLKMKSPPSQSESEHSPIQLTVPVLVQPERSTVLTEYSQ
ncbi:uncharacterized protein LOC132991641 [Labrus mixtus]|uniref:uncharacterized protein LOC132991641 n=1 Tax=Labrus mixtus TaxID=508554 RepID=UPI0029C0548A|nr:uncharacterized protein LOC132991641 [Labrus mixtus]